MNDNLIKYFPRTFFLSFLIHLIVVGIFISFNQKKEIVRTTIIDLGSYRDFSDKPVAKDTIKKKTPLITKKKTKAKKKLKVLEKKKEDKLSVKKIPIETTKESVLSKNIEKKIQKIEKTIDDNNDLEKVEENSKVIKKPLRSDQNLKNKNIKINKNLKAIQDRELKEYLISISSEINILANNQYPIQSIKRREQGSIVTRVNIDRYGYLNSFKVITKKPSRLNKSVNKILKKKNKFKAPPSHLFQNSEKLTFEININYILK